MPPKGYEARRTPEQEAARFEQGRAEAEARKQQSAEYYKLHGEREIHSTPGFAERQAAREAYLSGNMTAEEATAIPGVTVGSDALYQVTSGRTKVPFQSLWPEATIDNPPAGLTPEQTTIWQDYGAVNQGYADFPGWSYYSQASDSAGPAGMDQELSPTSLPAMLAAGVGLVLLLGLIK